MPTLTIDQREVEVPPGATVLDAARKLGIDIPTLCFLEGCPPSTSCLVCMVKIVEGNRLVPSCATVATDGMQIESETEEVHRVRRSALELLLSDHLGDCLAPCYFACPARMDIPQMLRQIQSGQLAEAIVTVKRDIALPAVLGRICSAPCEKACRRRGADGAVAICRLKRFVADADLSGGERYSPDVATDSGKRVVIVGAGPTGLAAAYYLRQQGHACMIIDENGKLGGRLLAMVDDTQLPQDVLDADVGAIVRLGVELRLGVRLEGSQLHDRLAEEFDAVLLACGADARQQAPIWELPTTKRGIEVEKGTHRTETSGVFAAGSAVRGNKIMVVRSVADGKEAAVAIGQYLAGQDVTGPQKPFNTRMGKLKEDELAQFLEGAGDAPRSNPAAGELAGFEPNEAVDQAARCLHCDCRALADCRLRQCSDAYQADPRRYPAQRRPFEQNLPHREVIYEPGKCISCGLCIEIASAAGEPLGLTFIGRGFDVRVGVPLHRELEEALRSAAADCAKACPTGAIALKEATFPGRR